MNDDPFDDDDDTGALSPEQFVAQGLEAFERGKRMPKSSRPPVFRSAHRFLKIGLAWSDQRGPRLSDQRADEARRAMAAVTSELATLRRANDPRTTAGLEKRLNRLLKKPNGRKPKRK